MDKAQLVSMPPNCSFIPAAPSPRLINNSYEKLFEYEYDEKIIGQDNSYITVNLN